MGRPSKPMAKNSNNRFTTRNNKQAIFSRITKTSKEKPEVESKTTVSNESVENNTESTKSDS